MISPKLTSIADLNAHVKRLLEHHTKGDPVGVQGRIRRYYKSDLEHVYFEIVENDYAIPCFLRNSIRPTIGFAIEKGLRVQVVGEIRVYDKEATLQIEVTHMTLLERPAIPKPAELEAQLRANGLWRDQKRPLPNPQQIGRIAVITSATSEAYGDFETTYRKRGGRGQPFLAPVPLQGDSAAQAIADTIKMFSQRADVIVLTRGGGRPEELAIFNDPLIAEAIYRSPKPIVTGIGHQSDETLADRAGDLIAITPTDAALQLLAPTSSIPPSSVNRWLVAAILVGIVVIVALLIILVGMN